MTRRLVFAANWKMHLTPDEARGFARTFLDGFTPAPARACWIFPSAVSLEATARAFAGTGVRVGAQDIFWEPRGAFTGATSGPLAAAAGAGLTLVGHSERRHVFGESEPDTARKVRAALASGLDPVLCVGERVEEREQGLTTSVVHRQLTAALEGLETAGLARVTVAYEPVWAIGTGRHATPEDAATVHRALRAALRALGHPDPVILYGGSVNAGNVSGLLTEPELDGVLVGGASLEAAGWRRLMEARLD